MFQITIMILGPPNHSIVTVMMHDDWAQKAKGDIRFSKPDTKTNTEIVPYLCIKIRGSCIEGAVGRADGIIGCFGSKLEILYNEIHIVPHLNS